MLAVFDCMVYFQAAISSKGPAAACLKLVEDGDVSLFVSPAIIEEVQDVLARPHVRKRFRQLTDERVDLFLQHIGQIARLVSDVPSVFELPRDPGDVMYIDLAIQSAANYLVSHDKDLLTLMNQSEFSEANPNLQILNPPSFLRVARDEIARKLGYE